MKDNSIHMPCIIAPKTFSYILNVGAQLPPTKIERAERAHNRSAVCCSACWAAGARAYSNQRPAVSRCLADPAASVKCVETTSRRGACVLRPSAVPSPNRTSERLRGSGCEVR